MERTNGRDERPVGGRNIWKEGRNGRDRRKG
jgi:hypothetical protein